MVPKEARNAPSFTDLELADWQESVGRTQTRCEVLAAEPLRRYALATGADANVEGHWPALGHWAYFLPAASDDAIGLDGHPARGDFLPPVPLPRRMFAGSAITFESPLALEGNAILVSQIASVSHKRGRSGDLVFVEVDQAIEQHGSICVRERQKFVYRGNGSPIAMPEPRSPLPEGEIWQPDQVTLFRFSAATFNSHRIHYDLAYAREREGYPGLVVHGPFTAAKLAAIARRDGPLARFTFRAMAPLFLGQPIHLRSAERGTLEAIRCDGEVAMRAEYDLL